MSFELRVEFAGLCLYMIDPLEDGVANRVAIVMPDARKKTANPMHVDGTTGEHHVGYVRFDLANLNIGQGPLSEPGELDDGAGDPLRAIIHRFDGEELDLGLNDTSTPVGHKLGIPHFNDFADSLTKKQGLFSAQPPSDLLMRTTLNGGKIFAQGSGKMWGFSSVLKQNPNGIPASKQFAGYSVWTRPVEQRDLTVTIRKFDGSVTTTIPLRPVPVRDSKGDVRNRITMKIANLCAHNPLEWDDFRTRTVVDRDIDFKWLYRLLEPNAGNYQSLLKGAELPFPREVSVQAFGDEDCMGGSITTTIP